MLRTSSFYAPYSRSFDEIRPLLRLRADNSPLGDFRSIHWAVRFQTLEDRLAYYFERPEAKSFPPDGKGLLERRTVIALGKRYCGKETPFSARDIGFAEIEDEPSPAMPVLSADADDGIGTDPLMDVLRSGGVSVAALAREVRISRPTLHAIQVGEQKPSEPQRAQIADGIARLRSLARAPTADRPQRRLKRAAQGGQSRKESKTQDSLRQAICGLARDSCVARVWGRTAPRGSRGSECMTSFVVTKCWGNRSMSGFGRW